MTSFLNMVKVAIADTGTGSVTVGDAADGFLTPAQAGAIDATEYIWILKEGLDWEIFRGAPSSSGTVIARTTVEQSFISGSVGTSKMDLGGNATLRCICSADVLHDLLNSAEIDDGLITGAVTQTDDYGSIT